MRRGSIRLTLALATTLVSTTVAPAGAVNDVDDVHPALDSQVVDSITTTNVTVLGDSPAIAMGNLYAATAQSLGTAYNSSPDSVTNSVTLTSLQITALMAPTTRAKGVHEVTDRQITAMAQRIRQCGDGCVVNMHFHVTPIGQEWSSVALTPAEVAEALGAEFEEELGDPLQGMGWVIPDGDDGSDEASTRARASASSIHTSRVTSVDIHLHRRLHSHGTP